MPTDGLPTAVTQRLRTETRAAHDRLESDLDLLGVEAGDLCRRLMRDCRDPAGEDDATVLVLGRDA